MPEKPDQRQPVRHQVSVHRDHWNRPSRWTCTCGASSDRPDRHAHPDHGGKR